MPLILRLTRYVVLPEDWCNYQFWFRCHGVQEFLKQSVESREDVADFVESLGGLEKIVDDGYFSKTTEKRCPACEQTKPILAFNFTGKSSRGKCRECESKRDHRRYHQWRASEAERTA